MTEVKKPSIQHTFNLPKDVFLYVLLPHAITNMYDAFQWRRICKAVFNLSKTKTWYWERALLNLNQERITWLKMHKYSKLADCLQKLYIPFSKLLIDHDITIMEMVWAHVLFDQPSSIDPSFPYYIRKTDTFSDITKHKLTLITETTRGRVSYFPEERYEECGDLVSVKTHFFATSTFKNGYRRMEQYNEKNNKFGVWKYDLPSSGFKAEIEWNGLPKYEPFWKQVFIRGTMWLNGKEMELININFEECSDETYHIIHNLTNAWHFKHDTFFTNAAIYVIDEISGTLNKIEYK